MQNLMLMRFKGKGFWYSVVVFLISATFLQSASYNLVDNYHFDIKQNPDIGNYMQMARGEIAPSPVRRYRVIVPFLAGTVYKVLGKVLNKVEQQNFPDVDFALVTSFMLVNIALMSMVGVVLFWLGYYFSNNFSIAMVGVLAMLSSRQAAYIAGLPLVDSLYLLVCSVALYALLVKNNKLLYLTIFLGPWAKESFVFVAPILFFFSQENKIKLGIAFVLSGLVVFAFRYWLDNQIGVVATQSYVAGVNHVENFGYSLGRLFSFHGVYELFCVVGLWGILILLTVYKPIREKLFNHWPIALTYYLIPVTIQALLSGELMRMFYLAVPVLAVLWSIILRYSKEYIFQRFEI